MKKTVASAELPSLASLAEEESRLEARAAELLLQARALDAQRAAARAAREAAEGRTRIERKAVELGAWAAQLQVEVSRAVSLLDAQRRDEVARCAVLDASLRTSIAELEAMRVCVRQRAAALESSYAHCAQRMCAAAEEALIARRAEFGTDAYEGVANTDHHHALSGTGPPGRAPARSGATTPARTVAGEMRDAAARCV
jgi:hypothetical protein